MSVVLLLRGVLALMVAAGIIINLMELVETVKMRARLRRAKVNGTRHKAAKNFYTAAKFRLIEIGLLAVVVGVMMFAPAPQGDAAKYAVISRIAFIALAWTLTQNGFSARQGRRDLETLIEATRTDDEHTTGHSRS